MFLVVELFESLAIGYTWSGWYACFPAYTFLSMMVVYGKYMTLRQGKLLIVVAFLMPINILIYIVIIFMFFIKE